MYMKYVPYRIKTYNKVFVGPNLLQFGRENLEKMNIMIIAKLDIGLGGTQETKGRSLASR